MYSCARPAQFYPCLAEKQHTSSRKTAEKQQKKQQKNSRKSRLRIPTARSPALRAPPLMTEFIIFNTEFIILIQNSSFLIQIASFFTANRLPLLFHSPRSPYQYQDPKKVGLYASQSMSARASASVSSKQRPSRHGDHVRRGSLQRKINHFQCKTHHFKIHKFIISMQQRTGLTPILAVLLAHF